MTENVVHFFEGKATGVTCKSNHVFLRSRAVFFSTFVSFLLLHSFGFHLKAPQNSIPPVVCFRSVDNVCHGGVPLRWGGASKRLDLCTCFFESNSSNTSFEVIFFFFF